jgi:hypothetical protein
VTPTVRTVVLPATTYFARPVVPPQFLVVVVGAVGTGKLVGELSVDMALVSHGNDHDARNRAVLSGLMSDCTYL